MDRPGGRRTENQKAAVDLRFKETLEACMRAFLAALSCAFLAALLFEPTSWAHSLVFTYLASDPEVPAEGVIESIKSHRVSAGRGPGYYVCDFTYTYRVGGAEFTSRVFSFDGRPRCRDIAGKYSVGQLVTVFHDRDKPGYAVIERVEGIPRAFLPISVIWGSFVLYLVIHVYRYASRRRALRLRVHVRSKQ